MEYGPTGGQIAYELLLTGLYKRYGLDTNYLLPWEGLPHEIRMAFEAMASKLQELHGT